MHAGDHNQHRRERQRAVEVGREEVEDRQRHRLRDALEASRRTSASRRTRRAPGPSASAEPGCEPGHRGGDRRPARTSAPRRRPSVREASSRVRSTRLEGGLRLAHVERRGDEGQRDDDAGRLEHELDPGVVERSAERARSAERRQQRDAGHGGREHERQLDQRDHQRAAAEARASPAARRPACRPTRMISERGQWSSRRLSQSASRGAGSPRLASSSAGTGVDEDRDQRQRQERQRDGERDARAAEPRTRPGAHVPAAARSRRRAGPCCAGAGDAGRRRSLRPASGCLASLHDGGPVGDLRLEPSRELDRAQLPLRRVDVR